MTKSIIIYLFLSFVTFNILAQNDYVISNPNKNHKKPNLSQPDSFQISNPDYTSYFLNSTAYTLEKNQIRLSGTDVIFVKGSYGLTDNTMTSINISILGTATASLKQQIHINESLKLGASASGGILLFSPSNPNIHSDRDTNIYLGGGQVMVTLGDKQDNLTIGTGLYYIKSTFDLSGNGDYSLLMNNIYIGFQKQISKKIYVMAEGMNYLNYHIFTGAIGIKAVIGDRIALNFGFMPLGFNDPSTNRTEIPIAIPLISFRMLLGRH